MRKMIKIGAVVFLLGIVAAVFYSCSEDEVALPAKTIDGPSKKDWRGGRGWPTTPNSDYIAPDDKERSGGDDDF